MGVLIFIITLVVLIVGHEAGHLLAAKRAGMEVPEFGVGFPPKLWSFVRGATEYSFNALPFGGFVRIVGENGDADHPNAFGQKSRWAQVGVLGAGPFANVALGFAAFWFAFMVGVPTAVEDMSPTSIVGARVVVTQLLSDSPAARAGVLVGDEVVSISGAGRTSRIERPSDIPGALIDSELTLEVLRRGEAQIFLLTPEAGLIPGESERRALGIGTMLIGTVAYDPLTALLKAGEALWRGLVGVTLSLATLVLGTLTFSASLADISGPVGIASIAGDAATFGPGHVLTFVGIISLNLAILNLLPFPALDGGRIMLVVIEAIRGRALKQQLVHAVNALGFVLLIALMLVVTWNDIAKLVT